MPLFNKQQQPEEQFVEMPQMPEQSPMLSVPYSMIGREKADLIEKIKPENAIEGLKYRLLGYELKDGTWKKVDYLQEYAVSERGAWELTNLIFSVSNQNVSISNLDEDKIKLRSLATMKAAVCMMIDYWNEYNIKSSSQIRYLSEIIFNITFITLHQPFNAGIQNLIKGTQQEQRTFIESPIKKGFLSMMFNKR